MRESSSMSHSAGSLVLGGRRNGEPSDGNGALERHMLPDVRDWLDAHTNLCACVREGKSWGGIEEKSRGEAERGWLWIVASGSLSC